MKFRAVAAFEFAYQWSRPSTWMFAAILVIVQSIIAVQAFLPAARTGGYFFNSPFVVGAITVIVTLVALPMIASVAGDAATRDISSRMESLIETTSVSRSEYLAGRFTGALATIATLAALSVLTLALLGQLPATGTGVTGPFRPAGYAGAWFLIAFPTVFGVSALLFTLAGATRRAISSYIGAAALFFVSIFANAVLAKRSGLWMLAGQLDPFALTVFSELSRLWTPAQKSALTIAPAGALLANRALWSTAALTALIAHVRLRPGRRKLAVGHRARWEPVERIAANESDAGASPVVARDFGPATRLRQVFAIARRSARQIASSYGAIALTTAAMALVVSAPGFITHLGTPLYPTTARMILVLSRSGDIFWLIAPLLAVLYAGELVWSERDVRMHHIADAVPVPDWVWIAGMLGGLTVALAVFQCLMMTAAVLAQSLTGYHHFELGLYVRALFGLQFVDSLLFAALGIAVHVLVNHKYAAHLLLLLVCALAAFGPMAGIENNLLLFASDPGWQYSDMRGFDPFLTPLLWFKFYWAAWALVLLIVAALFRTRGVAMGFAERVRRARRKSNLATTAALTVAVGIVAGVGAFILYNTEVLNAGRSPASTSARRAAYERNYRRFAGLPQPRLTGVSLQVEISPAQHEAVVRGTYNLINDSASPMESLHLSTATTEETRVVNADRAIVPLTVDDWAGYRIFALPTPLSPGQSLRLTFEVRHRRRGFPNNDLDTSVVSNGTHISSSWLPRIGYEPGRELTSVAARAEQGLRPEPPHDPDGESSEERARSERISFDAVVGTVANQTAVAPGSLRRTWTNGSRRYFHYATNAPIRNSFSIYSAVYSIHRSRWRDVAIEILHDPAHAANLERLTRSVRSALETYSKSFGPYPYAQVRLVEAPGPGVGLHSDPIDIGYSEGFALLNPSADSRDIDLTSAVVAHEVAHQWFGNQVSPARVSGASLVTESVAWYCALTALENLYGPEHVGRFLDVLREDYATPRSRAGVPLLKAADWFVAYRRGALAMYTVREIIGRRQMDLALRTFFDTYKTGQRPLPTANDLYAALQAVTPPALRPLLADLFERNTFWDLSTKAVHAERTSAREWRVTIDLSARKFAVDEFGTETRRPMNDEVEIGVFSKGTPIYLGKQKIVEGNQRVTILVAGEPLRAGVDPRSLLPDPDWSDNTKAIAK